LAGSFWNFNRRIKPHTYHIVVSGRLSRQRQVVGGSVGVILGHKGVISSDFSVFIIETVDQTLGVHVVDGAGGSSEWTFSEGVVLEVTDVSWLLKIRVPINVR